MRVPTEAPDGGPLTTFLTSGDRGEVMLGRVQQELKSDCTKKTALDAGMTVISSLCLSKGRHNVGCLARWPPVYDYSS